MLKFLIIFTIISFNTQVQAQNTIFTSIKSIQYILKSVLQNKWNITSFNSNKQNSHHYMLNYADINAIKSADIVIYVDSLEENFIAKILPQASKQSVIELTKIKDIELKYSNNAHKHLDTHLTLSPNNVKKILISVRREVCRYDTPENCQFFSDNIDKFVKHLDEVSKNIAKELELYEQTNLLINHNSINYFTDSFHLQTPYAIYNQHDDMLTFKQIDEIQQYINNHKIKCLLIEQSESSANILKLAKKWQIPYIYINTENNANNSYIDMLIGLKDNIIKCLAN